MAVEIKVAPDERLELVRAQITDTTLNSDYFNVTELSDTFSGGKNAFLIAGSELLEPNTEVKVQIRDSAGEVVYCEFSDGYPDEYYEGISKVVAVYVYPTETAFGPATITLIGQIRDSLDLVKWERKINIDPSLPNTTRVRFYKRPKVSIVEELAPIYSFDITGSKVASNVTQSFANIKISQLDTFAGDVKRVKVFRTSEGDISDYDLIQDILIESKELLTTTELSGSVISNAGLFTSETLSKLWNTGSLITSLTSSRIDNGLSLKGSGYLRYTSSLNLNSGNTYELGIDAFYSASIASDLGIYVSGSQNGETLVGILNGTTPTKNLTDQVFAFTLDKAEPTASLYLSQSQSEWHVGNISLKLSEDSAFSPSEVSFITSMPTVIGNETYNFKFEFYDVNNNFVPVAVTQSALFTGGNNNIGGTLTIVSASTTALSQSVSYDLWFNPTGSVTASIQFVSQSASSSISSVSSSVSGTIANVSSSLSSSISQSKAAAISSSFGNLQTLANGNFSGSFISDTTIYAPVIGGTTGYISQLFKVGTAPSIYLDARQSPRKIFIGGAIPSGQTEYSGAFNNSNTTVYMDSSGKFSLGNKLTWDGNTLNVTGIINITSGPTYDSIATAQSTANTAQSTANTAQSTANSAQSTANSAQSTANTAIDRIFTDAAGKIVKVAAPSGKGLFLSSTHLGYYNTTDYPSSPWRTYMNSDGDFYLNGAGSNGLTWNAAASTLSIDGNITARNGTFYGNITSNATISGGTITGGAIVGSTLSGATGTFTGTITAAAGTIGNWTIDSGNLRTANSRMILNPTAPSITLTDSGGNAKTTIRTGALSTISSAVMSVSSFNIISPNILYTGAESDTGKVYTEAATSLGSQTAGLYNSAYSFNYTSTLVRVDALTSGLSEYIQGVDILDSVGNVIQSFQFGKGTATNFSGNSSPTTNTGGSGTGFISLTLPANDTYFARPWQSYKVRASGAGYAIIYPLLLPTPSLSFTKVTGFAELTDEGLQIVSSTNRFIKLRTGGLYDLDAQGSWQHDNGDVSFVQNTGGLYARGSLVTTTAGNYSDIRLKEDISDYTHGLSHIKQFNPKWFRFKKRYNEKMLSGLIAQDVEAISNEYINEDLEGFKELNYPAIYMTMLNAIKELSLKVEELEAQLSGSK